MIIYEKRMNLLTAMPAELERTYYINYRYTSSSMSIDKSLRFLRVIYSCVHQLM